MARLVYKIVSADTWRIAERVGVFRGVDVDLRDGFIHFSAAHQVRDTFKKYFAGRNNLLLVAVDVLSIEDGLRWEPSRGGELFPHLYRELQISEVTSVEPISENSDVLNRAEFQKE